MPLTIVELRFCWSRLSRYVLFNKTFAPFIEEVNRSLSFSVLTPCYHEFKLGIITMYENTLTDFPFAQSKHSKLA